MRAKFCFFFLIVVLLGLSGCGEPPECGTDADCLKPHFTSVCVDDKCIHTPVPGECGNGLCEEGETKCNCDVDCGPCMGPSGPFELVCVGDDCLEGIPKSQIKPSVSTAELSAGGDKLRVTSTFNQPFNVLSDTFDVKISLSSASDNNADRLVKKMTLIGQTSDKQTVPLAELDLNRPLWPGSEIGASLIVDLPAVEKQGSISNLELQITYEYVAGSAPKSTVVKNKYSRITFNWVRPSTPYPCPASCDDGNPGTEDVCDASTNFFCVHIPKPNVCGNYVCDAAENPCTCPFDCGPCDSSAGADMIYACISNNCIAQVKAGISKIPKSLFDDRKMTQFHLQNNYGFMDPFDVSKDAFNLEFSLYDLQSGVSDVKIATVRLFEGTNELNANDPNLALPDVGSSGSVVLNLPPQVEPEAAKTLTLKVWYEYTQGGEVKKNSYTKSLGKIILLSPGLPK